MAVQCVTVVGRQWAAVPQELERILYYPEGRWFDPRLLQSACRCVFGREMTREPCQNQLVQVLHEVYIA